MSGGRISPPTLFSTAQVGLRIQSGRLSRSPEKTILGTGVTVEVVRYLAHLRIQPESLRILVARGLAEPIEHCRPVRFIRHTMLAPDDHRRGAYLTIGDPAEAVLVVPVSEPLGAAERTRGRLHARAASILAGSATRASVIRHTWRPPSNSSRADLSESCSRIPTSTNLTVLTPADATLC